MQSHYRLQVSNNRVMLSIGGNGLWTLLWAVDVIGDQGVVTDMAYWATYGDMVIALQLADNITAAIEPQPTVPSLIELYTNVTLVAATINVIARHYARLGKVIIEIG